MYESQEILDSGQLISNSGYVLNSQGKTDIHIVCNSIRKERRTFNI